MRSPLFFGVFYLLLIPIYALIYQYIPDIYNTLTLNDGKTLLNFYQSIYFSAVTITTLGYGDISPNNAISQLTSASEAVLGIVLIGLFLNSISQRSQYNQTKALEERVISLINSILSNHIHIIQKSTLNRIPQTKIKFSILSEEIIKNNMKNVFYKSPIPSHTGIVGETVANCMRKINASVEGLMAIIVFLDPKLINIISSIENKQMFDRWLIEYNTTPPVTRYGVIHPYQDMDISEHSNKFYQLHLIYHTLHAYLVDNFSHNYSVASSIMSNAIVHNSEYNKGLKYAKYLFKDTTYAKNAYFLAIIAYLKLSKIKKAKWALNKYIDIASKDANFVKEQIEKHYSEKITKKELSYIF
ncbi:potassium channel family protein [Poseidonibacter lekithochrous]|nr:potassium channel family protein [Poseidonibacter sp. 1_MG-2023]MBU3013187.1 potassium channel family protein [Poseidonibacter lekithochrous]MDO6826483.1 potassium channel family protein [Poseidonibacter sp. 1_MG-2023]